MLYALLFILAVLLICVWAVHIPRTRVSRFELERRAKAGESMAQKTLKRDAHLADLLTLQRVISICVIIPIVVVSVVLFGLLGGAIGALVITLGCGSLSRFHAANQLVQKTYTKYESTLLGWIEKAPFAFSLLRSVTIPSATDPELHSREQLLHLVDHSHDIITPNQKLLFRHSLQFDDTVVSDIMTPRSAIDSVAASELLGPLVLDDLHKTGHSRFPVVEGDVDHIVGMLHIRDLLTLDAGKRTTTAKKAMEPRVFYIKESQTLDQALAAFLHSHHHLFVVINESRETVGLLSLEDVMTALLGRKVMDRFDSHEDFRAVAERNAQSSNNSSEHVDSI